MGENSTHFAVFAHSSLILERIIVVKKLSFVFSSF